MYSDFHRRLPHPPTHHTPHSAWKHPKVTAFVTCFGDLPKQQPRVVRCACGKSPCGLRGLSEGAGVTAVRERAHECRRAGGAEGQEEGW